MVVNNYLRGCWYEDQKAYVRASVVSSCWLLRSLCHSAEAQDSHGYQTLCAMLRDRWMANNRKSKPLRLLSLAKTAAGGMCWHFSDFPKLNFEIQGCVPSNSKRWIRVSLQLGVCLGILCTSLLRTLHLFVFMHHPADFIFRPINRHVQTWGRVQRQWAAHRNHYIKPVQHHCSSV